MILVDYKPAKITLPRCRERIPLTIRSETYCMLPFGHPGDHLPSTPAVALSVRKIPCSCLDCKKKKLGIKD